MRWTEGHLNAYNALGAYLPVGWNDTSTDTAIVGTTFRQKFTDYYTAKQALLNAMNAKGAITASWDGVSGPGKPGESRGSAINVDPAIENPSNWSIPSGLIIADAGGQTAGLIGRRIFTTYGTTLQNILLYDGLRYPLDQTRTYNLMEINKVEAASQSLFVTGWRPAIGWVCGAAFAFKFILGPAAVVVMAMAGQPITLAEFDFTEMSTIVLAMLGLGGLRTVGKVKEA